jgi:hypothetical protein
MKMKSRKLWFALGLMGLYIGSAFTGFGNELMVVSTPILTIFGTYIIGNVGSKIITKK